MAFLGCLNKMNKFLILGENQLCQNYAWLCDYGSHAVANTYGIVVQTPEFDVVELFFLEQKKNAIP